MRRLFPMPKMLVQNTPVEYFPEYDLYVKREDLCCPWPGPPFSKTRGVYPHIKKRPEKLIGVLDTYHSQAGHAVARACALLGKGCINFYPRYKRDLPGVVRPPQQRSLSLGAELYPLQAGRSAVLFHQARKVTEAKGGYMMPNALKLPETVAETAEELKRTPAMDQYDTVVISVSSATIGAGVLLGLRKLSLSPRVIFHAGYSRSEAAVRKYVETKIGFSYPFEYIDEGYEYSEKARPGPTPEYPCNIYYDLKAFRWLTSNRLSLGNKVLMWHVG
jgi:1-aminocyclopropane-1-carboxylate deaminase/D-cysteine desulfhydrase-like pyridoxal-dependent ACC family enzyme